MALAIASTIDSLCISRISPFQSFYISFDLHFFLCCVRCSSAIYDYTAIATYSSVVPFLHRHHKFFLIAAEKFCKIKIPAKYFFSCTSEFGIANRIKLKRSDIVANGNIELLQLHVMVGCACVIVDV